MEMRDTPRWKVSIQQVQPSGDVHESNWPFLGMLPRVGDEVDQYKDGYHYWTVTAIQWFTSGRGNDSDPMVRILTALESPIREVPIEMEHGDQPREEQLRVDFRPEYREDMTSEERLRARVQAMRDTLDAGGQEPGIVDMLDGVLGGGPIAFSVAGDMMPRLAVVQLNDELVKRFDRLAAEPADAELPQTREALMEEALTRFATQMEQGHHGDPTQDEWPC